MIDLHTHNLPRGSRAACVMCKQARSDLMRVVSWVVAAGVFVWALSLLVGCGAPTCQTATLALWQDLEGQYRATIRCGQLDGSHANHDVLSSQTPIEAPCPSP